LAYNLKNGITPRKVVKSIQESLSNRDEEADEINIRVVADSGVDYDVNQVILDIESEMLEAARVLEFERAALLRDQISALRTAFDVGEGSKKKPAKTTYSKRKG
jgi:excinuclease ABC subunit B